MGGRGEQKSLACARLFLFPMFAREQIYSSIR